MSNPEGGRFGLKDQLEHKLEVLKNSIVEELLDKIKKQKNKDRISELEKKLDELKERVARLEAKTNTKRQRHPTYDIGRFLKW